MGFSWDWKYGKKETLYGNLAYLTDHDYDSKSLAKKSVEAWLKSLYCKKCGSDNLVGGNLLVEIKEVSLFHKVEKNKFFGGTKLVEEHWKDVWRVGDLIFKDGGVFGGGGYIECRKCKNKVKGGGFWSQWASNIADARRRGEI